MILKEYFNRLELSTFGSQLSKFKSTFSDVELESEYQAVLIKFLEVSKTSICQEFTKILNNSLSIYKNFVLSPSRESEYAKCRALKKVPDIKKLIAKFEVKDDQFKTIENHTKALIDHIDVNGHIYYAIANKLESSDLEILPPEIIGHIFHYVDGEINL